VAGGGSFDLNPVQAALSNPALQIQVCSYDPSQSGDSPSESDQGPLMPLPNVMCERIDQRTQGVVPEPAVAHFRYVTDNYLDQNLDWPSQYENIWPIGSQGPYVVQTDDRIAVLAYTPGGDPIVLFDGFAQIPQVAVGAVQQSVKFTAISVETRLWDTPIKYRVQRDADAPTDTSGESDEVVALACRFNPADTSVGGQGGYIANGVGDDYYTSDAQLGQYPVFIDPIVAEASASNSGYWYVSDAVEYLIVLMQTFQGWQQYVQFPTISSIEQLLNCQQPPQGSQVLNSGDAQVTDIPIRDYDATNKHYVEVIAELLNYCGFVLSFKTNADENGNPQTSMVIARRDNLSTVQPKPVYHAAYGATELDPSANNVSRYHLAFDSNQIVNQVTVDTALKQVEATFYLAPLFQPLSSDITSPSTYYKQNLTSASAMTRRKYRWYGVDEIGAGYYNMQTSTWVTGETANFDQIFPPDQNGNLTYAVRSRKPSRTLISTDSAGRPLHAKLEVQFGYQSGPPGLPPRGQSFSGTWDDVPDGWRLLDDRLGIEINVDNPEDWKSGNTATYGGVIRGISWVANPTASGKITVGSSQVTPYLALRLTTVIEADTINEITAAKRIASPTQYARERRIDGRDHFQYCSVFSGSLHYTADGGDGTNPYVARDDTQAATTHAQQIRSAHEMPTLAGSLTIPFITDYYQLGDRINMIHGRDASLQTNAAGNSGEAPSYPWVVARSFVFEPRQETALELSDRRAEVRNAW
jgi:hypothetical protein